jgi:hypothetical protein
VIRIERVRHVSIRTRRYPENVLKTTKRYSLPPDPELSIKIEGISTKNQKILHQ